MWPVSAAGIISEIRDGPWTRPFGISSTIMDSACGYAAFTLMPAEARVLTIEFKINLLAPAAGDVFRAVGKVRKAGRSVSVAEADLLARAEESRYQMQDLIVLICQSDLFTERPTP